MPQLLGIRIRNFRSLRDVTLGKISFDQGVDLPPLMAFIGPNGSGKSSLLDAFGFVSDCLKDGVEAACDKPHRGGFLNLRTRGVKEAIHFDLYYRQDTKSRPITYQFAVNAPKATPIIVSETLRQRRKGNTRGQPYPFLKISNGKGEVWAGESTEEEEGSEKRAIKLTDRSRLAITTLGQFSDHPRINSLREYLESWYLSYFIPDAARRLPASGAQPHLDRTGENLGNYVQYLQARHPDRFKIILDRVAQRIPGIQKIVAVPTLDNRVLLKFNESGYQDPFYQHNMSDGTLKIFAYMLLLEDPQPSSFIGIEEPENGLYHKLLHRLAREFQSHASESGERTQVLVTTHSPHFVDALRPEQLWLLRKLNGATEAVCTSTMPLITEMVREGIPLGSLWYSNHLDEGIEA